MLNIIDLNYQNYDTFKFVRIKTEKSFIVYIQRIFGIQILGQPNKCPNYSNICFSSVLINVITSWPYILDIRV